MQETTKGKEEKNTEPNESRQMENKSKCSTNDFDIVEKTKKAYRKQQMNNSLRNKISKSSRNKPSQAFQVGVKDKNAVTHGRDIGAGGMEGRQASSVEWLEVYGIHGKTAATFLEEDNFG